MILDNESHSNTQLSNFKDCEEENDISNHETSELLPWPFTPPKADVYLPGYPVAESTIVGPLTTTPRNIEEQQSERFTNKQQQNEIFSNKGFEITERSILSNSISTTTENDRRNR